MPVLDHQRQAVGSSRHRLSPKEEDLPMVSRGGETSREAIFFDRSTPVVVIGFAGVSPDFSRKLSLKLPYWPLGLGGCVQMLITCVLMTFPIWLSVHLGLGLAWIALLVGQAGQGHGIGATGFQLFWMLLVAGWLPSWALACWQVRRRRWRALLASDLLAAGVMVLLALTVYLPLFFVNVVWFLPLALLPRGLLTELLLRLMTARRP